MTSQSTPGAQTANLEFRTIATCADRSLIEVNLQTGRKHQIRAQLSDYGHPIAGDASMAHAPGFPLGIALHSYMLTIEHPTLRTPMTFKAELPRSWSSLPAKLAPHLKTFTEPS